MTNPRTRGGRFLPSFGLAIACLSLLGSTPQKQAPKLRLIPTVTDSRLEDIQESPDGTRLLTHDRGFAPKLWDPKSMRILAILSGPSQSEVRWASLSKDGSLVLTTAGDVVRVWDSKRASLLREWKLDGFKVDKFEFVRAELSDDNHSVAMVGFGGELWLADNKDGAPLERVQLNGLGSAIANDVDFSSDGKLLAIGGMFHQVPLVEVSTKRVVGVLKDVPMGAGWVEFSADGEQVLVTGLDGKASLWSAKTFTKEREWEHVIGDKGALPNTLMAALFVGPKLENVLVAGAKGTMTLYDRKSGVQVRQLLGYKDPIREIRRSADGLKVATYCDNTYSDEQEPLRMWNVETGARYPYDMTGEEPTAGEFGGDSKAFWVGSQDGSIRRHDLATGAVHQTTLGATDRVDDLYQLGSSNLWCLQHGLRHFGFGDSQRTFSIIDGAQPAVSHAYFQRKGALPISADGDFGVIEVTVTEKSGGKRDGLAVFHLLKAKAVWTFWKDCIGAIWADKHNVVAWDEKSVHLFDMAKPGYVKQLYASTTKLYFVKTTPDGQWAFAFESEKGLTAINIADPSKSFVLDKVGFLFQNQLGVSADSRHVAWASGDEFVVRNLATGKELRAKTPVDQVLGDGSRRDNQIGFSPAGKYLILDGPGGFGFYDPDTGKPFYESQTSYYLNAPRTAGVSADDRYYAEVDRSRVRMIEIATGAVSATIQSMDDVLAARFTRDGSRVVVVDKTEQVVVYDASTRVASDDPAKPQTLKRLGNLVLMKDGSWLVLDVDGRYDASDPSNVAGASYAYTWSGGIEPIDVSQLKSLYYEPGLLGKLLGIDNEARRAVPDLNSIKLFPKIELKPNPKKPTTIQVSVAEQDGGGIGLVRVSINGKVVDERKGVGFFVFDASQYQQFFLPTARLPEGQGNLVLVTASNASSDLVSQPEVVDVGVPANLKTPDVNLYALLVGVNEYVGPKDLSAPVRDAEALAKAISQTAEGLLPRRVHISKLVAQTPEQRPSRANILKWLDDTAKVATSSDVVLVFFAGHGASSLGDKKGYFFLTADADPTDLSPAMLTTSVISSEDLQSHLGRIPAGKQLIILDTCHSGAAAGNLLGGDRASGSDYARAYEAIRDSTGTWLLAGSAADQLSYESANVEHGMLTYALLEGIDQASTSALREGAEDLLFVDVERWFSYAAGRVESLKNEVGIAGVQRPVFKRQAKGSSFDIGVLKSGQKGLIGLKPPMPILILGGFANDDDEDPLKLEKSVGAAFAETKRLKVWTTVSKHPNVYRLAGKYQASGDAVTIKVNVQRFDLEENRTTLESFEVSGTKSELALLVKQIQVEAEKRVLDLEDKRKGAPSG